MKKIKEMSLQHLSNAIPYWEKRLSQQPEAYYMGDSEYAEMAVECENRHNEEVARNIQNLIKRLKAELNRRTKSL